MSHRPILGASGIFFQSDILPIMQTIRLTLCPRTISRSRAGPASAALRLVMP